MRTKHLLMAMALPALFAACQQDEFMTDSTNADALQGRKSIGQVSFVAGNNADTRWAGGEFYNSITPEKADGLSVNLVDVPAYYPGKSILNSMHDYAIDNYTMVDFVNTNYRFNYTGNGWENQGNLVEGNYLIVAPFVKSESRKPLEAALPAKQQLKFKEGTKELDPASAVTGMLKGDAPFMVAYKFLEEGKVGRGMPLEFQSIYSYPLITVKNTNVTYAQGLVLRQIVIENPVGFTLKAPISADGVRNAMINEVFKPEGTDKVDQALLGSWTSVGTKAPANDLGNTVYWECYAGLNKYGAGVPKHQNEAKNDYIMLKQYDKATSDFVQLVGGTDKMPWTRGLGKTHALAPATSDLLAENNVQTTNYIVVDMPAEGVAMAYNDEVSFNVVMPAETYNNEKGQELKIYAIFDNVTWVKTLNTNTAITTLPGKQYPREDYTEPSNSSPEVKGQKGGYFNVYTNDQSRDYGTYAEATGAPTKPASPHVAVVATTDELAEAVMNARSDQDWVITVAGNNVVWNKDVNDKVAGSRTQNILVQGHVAIDGTITIADYISFEDAVIAGNVTIDGEHSTLNQVLVGKGATLNLGQLANKTSNKAVIYNAGTLNLNKDSYTTVHNFSELNVKADLTNAEIFNGTDHCSNAAEILSGIVNLKPSVNVAANGVYTLKDNAVNFPIVIAKDGKLIINTEVELNNSMTTVVEGLENIDVIGSITNSGTIDGNGKLTIPFKNESNFDNKAGSTVSVTTVVTLAAGDEKTISVAEYNALSSTKKISVGEGTLIIGSETDLFEETEQSDLNNVAALGDNVETTSTSTVKAWYKKQGDGATAIKWNNNDAWTEN